MRKTILYGFLVILTCVLALLLNACSSVTPTPVPTATPALTATPLLPTIAPTSTAILPTSTPAPTATPQPPTPNTPTFNLSHFTFIDNLNGWMVGYKTCGSDGKGYCIAMRTSKDGGKSWQDSPAPNASVSSVDYLQELPSKVRFANLKDGWVYGAKSLYVTHDGGQTWIEDVTVGTVSSIEPLGASVWAIKSQCSQPNPTQAINCNYSIVSSSNAGRTWQLLPAQPFATSDYPPAIVRPTQQNAIVFDIIRGEEGKLSITKNGGKSWQTTTPPCINVLKRSFLAAIDINKIWLACDTGAAGGRVFHELYATTDGTRSWSLVSSAHYSPDLDIGRLPALGISTIAFTNPTRGYMVCSRGNLFISNDGGKTWDETDVAKKYQGYWKANLIFTDPLHGWFMVGEDVNVVFRTTDGGATWEKFPVK